MYIIQKRDQQTTIRVANKLEGQSHFSYYRQFLLDRINDLWVYRELLQNLVVRDLKVRYKNSFLGVIWSLLNPLLMMLVFTAVFTVMRGQAIDKFPVFILIGLLPWQFFTNSLGTGAASIVGSSHLINKVFFPREILVISTVLSNLVNFLIALIVLVPIMLVFRIQFSVWILLLPVMIFVQLIFTLGLSFIAATANVFYRDVQMIIEVGLLAGFFLTPIFYSIDILPRSYNLFGVNLDVWRLVYILNPMASIIANYRVILLDGSPPAFDFLIRTFVTALIFLAIGVTFFYKYAPRFSEEL